MKTVLVLLIASCLMQYGKMEFNFANVLISRNSSVWTIPEPTAEMYIHCLMMNFISRSNFQNLQMFTFANVQFRGTVLTARRLLKGLDNKAAMQQA